MKKYFKVLGLEEGASKEEIEEAYIRLSKELDPATNDNLEFFVEEYNLVQEAYKKLTGNQPKEEKSDQSNDLFKEEDSIVTIMKRFRSSTKNEKFKILTFLEDHKTDSRFNQALNMIFKNEKIKSLGDFKSKNSINDTNTKRPNTNKNNKPKSKSSFIKKRYVIIFLLIASVGITYLLFQNKVDDFELNIPKIETNEMAKMETEKDFWVSKFKKDYPRLKSYYKDFGNPVFMKDTLIKLLFFSKEISFKSFDRDYFKCFYNHEVNRYKNKYNKEYLSWFNSTRKRFGLGSKTMNNLINIVKQSSSNNSDFPFLSSTSNIDIECKKCVPNYISSSELNAFSVKDFDGFVREYFKNKREIDKNNKEELNKYNSKFNGYRRNMSSSLIKTLNSRLKSKPVLNEKKVNYTFSGGETLGSITYSFIKKDFNEKSLEKIGDDVFKNFYKTNSLRTGSTPYAYCYGSNPYCSPPNGYAECSFIDVRASSSSDVIVLVKKNNIVYSHAYIKAGGYYKFKLGNGNFQTFFYYGNGWNPNKLMKNASCGKITGGFVSDETVDKSDIISLRNSSMSYTLYSVANGNFQPKSSNKNEAF